MLHGVSGEGASLEYEVLQYVHVAYVQSARGGFTMFIEEPVIN